MVHSASSSGIFFEGDEQSQSIRNLIPQNMYTNMAPVTDANSSLSLKQSASINTESYTRLPASPLSFNSNISGSSVIDGPSSATSLPNPRVRNGSMFHGSFVPDHDNVSHLLKKPRIDIKQEDILQQQTLRQMLQRQDSMQLQNPNQQLQALYRQQQLLQSLSPMQRAQLLNQQQQQLNSRQNIQQQQQQQQQINRPYDGSICALKIMKYLFHQRQRPADISYWRKFVAEYYSPRAKQRWCLSVHNNVGHHPSGVFPPANTDVWQCSVCGSKSGRGFEASFEVLPRLNEIKYNSGVIDEIWFLDLPRECRFPSGIMMLEYGKAIQESVYEQLHVVHEGRLKVIFTPDLKILSWEFCSLRHEELLPRRLLAPQVNKMLEVAQKWQSTIAESGSGGVSQQDLQTSSNMLVTAGRQLARSLDLQSLNDLGFTKRYVRCLQIAEVVTSMKDLMDFTRVTNIGPIEALKMFPKQTSVSKLQQGVNNSNFQMGSRGATTLQNYQNTLMRQSSIKLSSNSLQNNRSPFQGQPLQNNNSNIPVGYQQFPSGIFHVQQNQNQNQMNQQVLNNNKGSGAKPSVSGQSGGGGGPTRSNSFKGGAGSHSDSCAGGEKAPDLPHVSDVFQDIISEFTENGFFNNDEPGWKA